MKNAMIFCAAIALVAGLTVSASAGEHASAVPTSTLASMGFGSVQVMSDDAGLAVRGKGTYAAAWGTSTAGYSSWYGSASATNNYEAVADHRYGHASAAGGSDSFAGKVKEFGRFSFSTLYVSGGSAWSRAH